MKVLQSLMTWQPLTLQQPITPSRARPPQNLHPQAWFERHKGRRIFILLERHRLEQVRGLLPVAARQTVQVVDDSNNKLLLIEARI